MTKTKDIILWHAWSHCLCFFTSDVLLSWIQQGSRHECRSIPLWLWHTWHTDINKGRLGTILTNKQIKTKLEKYCNITILDNRCDISEPTPLRTRDHDQLHLVVIKWRKGRNGIYDKHVDIFVSYLRQKSNQVRWWYCENQKSNRAHVLFFSAPPVSEPPIKRMVRIERKYLIASKCAQQYHSFLYIAP